jgi:CheY-like chemotaxis protein
LGYRILEANHGAAAIEMIRTRYPDMVLLDLGLPDQDGYEILRQKNTDPLLQQIPVVVMTARDPQGGPVVAGRLRVELVGGLSLRDIAECTAALTSALQPGAKSVNPAPSAVLPA